MAAAEGSSTGSRRSSSSVTVDMKKIKPYLEIPIGNFAKVFREVVQRPVELFREAHFDGRADFCH